MALSRRSKVWIASCVVIAATAAAFLIWNVRAAGELAQTPETRRAPEPAPMFAGSRPAPVAATPVEKPAAPAHVHADEFGFHAATSKLLPVRENWWSPPDAEETPAATRIERDPSCSNSDFLGSSNTVEELLARHWGIADDASRERLFFLKDRRFFRLGGRFHQLSAVWDIAIPPRYRIEWFSAADAEMTQDIRQERSFGDQETVDAIDARRLLDRVTPKQDGNAEQGSPGARLLHVQIDRADGKPPQEVGFLNNRVYALSFPGGACRLLANKVAAYCECSQPSTDKETDS